MKRLYFLGGFLSIVILACFFGSTSVSAIYKGPAAGIIGRIFGDQNNNNNNEGQISIDLIRNDRIYQSECALEICSEDPNSMPNLPVCRQWAQETFGRSDCGYVNAAVNVEYYCVDRYRCLPNPNQTQLSREVRAACDTVLEDRYHTSECFLLRTSLLSDVLASLPEAEKRESLRIQNPSPEASSCVQTMCLNQSGGTVRARDLRVCSGWADLQLGTTSCSDMRRVVDDGSIESRSYQMTQEDEFTCVATLCGEDFIHINGEEERFCQDWANHSYGTNECNALLDAYAPEIGPQQQSRDPLYDMIRRQSEIDNNKRFAYERWKQSQIQSEQEQPQHQDQLTFGDPLSEPAFLALRENHRLNLCLPLLLQQNGDENNPERISFAVCQYLATEYGFYQNPSPSELAQCRGMGISPVANQQNEDADIERIRCRYWLARAQQAGDQFQINQNILPQEQEAQVNTPELFFESVTFENGTYTVTVNNSGFVPNPQIQPQLFVHWVRSDNRIPAQPQDLTELRLMVQPEEERQWIFHIDTNDLSRNFPPENVDYLEFIIDRNNTIEERNENNNTWAVAPRPDFRVLDTGNNQIIRDANIPIVITNQAPRSEFEGAVPFLFQWFGNQGELLSSIDGMAFMVARNHTYRADLALGQIPQAAVRFKITANPNQRIAEMNQQNNSYEYFFAPDLVINEVTTQKESLVVRIQNIGNTDVPLADFSIHTLYFGENGLPVGTSDQNLTQTPDQTTWTVRSPLENIPKQAVSVRFTVDFERFIPETNESNNTADYALSQDGITVAQNQDNSDFSQEKPPFLLPGDVFYGIKQAWRSLRLGLTIKPIKKAEYMMEVAHDRKNERIELIRKGKDLPENAPKIFDVQSFAKILKNIPQNELEKKQDLLRQSIDHIEFEYQTNPKDTEPIIFEYKPQPTDAEPIIFEYAPRPTAAEPIIFEYKEMEEFVSNFLTLLDTADDERSKRALISTLSNDKFGSAQKHLLTAVKISQIAEKAPTEIQTLLKEKESLLLEKVRESLEKEAPQQQQILFNTLETQGQHLVSAKEVLQTLKKQIANETIKSTLINPRLEKINTVLSNQGSNQEIPKTTEFPIISEECLDDNVVVCGKDGISYTSKCVAQKAGVVVVSVGRCPTLVPPALPTSTIIITKPTTTIIVPKPIDCANAGSLSVCGANGKTYSNSCYAEKDGIKVVSNGACPSITITPPPECTSNSGCDDKNSCTQNSCVKGKCVYTTYNACGTTEYSCTDGIDNDRNGKTDCTDSACSSLSFCAPEPSCDDSEVVCGRDGVTYTSECVAKAKGVIVDSYGKCPTAPLTIINTNTQTNTTLNTNTTISTQKRFTISGGKFESGSVSLSSDQTLLIQNLDTKEYTFGGGTIQGTIAAKGTKSVTFPSIGQYNTYLNENPSDVIMITVTK